MKRPNKIDYLTSKKLDSRFAVFNYYNDLENYVDELEKAVKVIRCCEELKVKDLMTFEDYKNNLFIKSDGVYQPKKTKLFRWYSEKQLKKMYKDKPL